MTVKLPEKAGFVATTAEWDQLVRIAENLAAQVVQAQQDAHRWATLANSAANERDAARDEVARLTAALAALIKQADVAWATLDHTENERLVSRLGCAVDDARAALRGDTAPAGGTSELIHEIEVNHKCKCGHWNGDHSESDDGGRRVCMHLGCDCIIDTAPAGGEARP